MGERVGSGSELEGPRLVNDDAPSESQSLFSIQKEGWWYMRGNKLHCQEQSTLPCTRLQITFTAEPIQIRVEPRVTSSVTSATCKDSQTGTFSADRNSCSPFDSLFVSAFTRSIQKSVTVCDRGLEG